MTGIVVISLRSGGAPNNKRRRTKQYIHTYNSEAVKLNSERKVRVQIRFLTLRSSLGYLYCSEVLEDCISPAR